MREGLLYLYFPFLATPAKTHLPQQKSARAILCTKYNLWTRTVDYGLAQLSVRTDRKKGSLGNHNADDSGNFMQKSFLVYSKILCVKSAFQLCWSEIAINGLEITRNKTTCRQVRSSTATAKQVISSRLLEEKGREMFLIEKCTYKKCKTARCHR